MRISDWSSDVCSSDLNVSGANGRYACGVVGIADGIIRDVTFSDVHVSSAGGGTAADAALEPPERRNSSLEPSFMKTFPAHGLYVRHAQRIAAVDCSFVTETDRKSTRLTSSH